MKRFTLTLLIITHVLFANAQILVAYTGMGSAFCPESPTATISPIVPGVTFSQIMRGSGVTCTYLTGSVAGFGFNTTLPTALSSNKWFRIDMTTDAGTSFTLNSLLIVARTSAVLSGNAASIQYSINDGPKTVIGSLTPTSSSATYTITPTNPIQVQPNQILNIYIIPYGLASSSTSFRVSNNTTINVTSSVAPACAGMPLPGNTISSANTTCVGDSVILSLQNYPSGSGIEYLWQSADDINFSLNSLNLGTGPTIKTASLMTRYYRCNVSCGTDTGHSIPVLVNTPRMNGVYTIDKSLPTGGTNFNSFTDVANALECHDVSGPVVFNVTMGSGPYNEQVTFPSVFNSSATNTITINGNGETLIFSSIVSTLPSTLTFNGTDYVNINDLTIQAMGTNYALACHLWNQADNNQFNNCLFKCLENAAVYGLIPFSISGSATDPDAEGASGSNNILTNCSFENGYAGLSFVGGSSNVATGNRVTNCGIRDFHSTGMYAAYQNATEFIGNTIERPNRTNLTYDFYGISVYMGCSNMNIRNNKIRDPFTQSPISIRLAHAIILNATASPGNENQIINNLIYNFVSNGTKVGINLYGSNYAKVYHNTISLDDLVVTSGTSQGITSGINGISIKNNIISISRLGNGPNYGVNYTGANASFSSNNNNIYVHSPLATNNHIVAIGSTTYSTLANWQVASGLDMASFSLNPLFTGLATFIPALGILDNIGANLGITEDIDGFTRSATNPDIGAYEFTAACSTPPDPGYTVASDTIACLNIPITLSLQNYDPGSGITYLWQSADDSSFLVNSTNLGILSTYTLIPTSTKFYRCHMSCSGNTVSSTPIKVIVPTPLSGTFSINQSLPTNGTNFNSFNAAFDAISCVGINGPIILTVAQGSGPYHEQVFISSIVNASLINTITINGNYETLTYGSTNSNAPCTLELNGTDYIRINNLTIEASNSFYSMACHLWNNANNNIFNSCTFTCPDNVVSNYACPFSISGFASAPIASGVGGINNTIINCTTQGGYYGLSLVHNTPSIASGNKVINCTIKDFYSIGIYTHYQNGTELTNNIIERPSCTTLNNFTGIYVFSCKEMLIQKNVIRSPFIQQPIISNSAYGIDINSVTTPSSGNENKIINNLIYLSGGGSKRGLNLGSSNYIKAYHNTISLDYPAGTTGTSRGIDLSGVSGIDIRNNSITISRSGSGTNCCLYYSTNSITLISNNNNLFINAPSGTNYIGYNGTNYSTLASWKTATGRDLASVNLNPLFISSSNFIPTQLAMNNLGAAVGITEDILELSRPASNPDIGAYEFPTSCTSPPNPGNTISSATEVCINSYITLSIQNTDSNFGITYQWQSSNDSLFSNTISNLGTASLNTLSPVASKYYRCLVTCGGNTISSIPIKVNVHTLPMVTTMNLTSCQGIPLNLSGTPFGGSFNITNPYIGSSTMYTYTFTDSNGCSSSSTSTIMVNASPIVTSSNVSGCAGDSIALFGTPSGGIFSKSNPYTGVSTTYQYTYTNLNGCSSSSTSTITVDTCNLTLHLKLFLQGYYSGAGLMVPVLLNQGVIGSTDITDAIIVQFRSPIVPFNNVSTISTLLHTNGTSQCIFHVPTGFYYIVIKHRNTVETWSQHPVYVSNLPSSYDFSISSSQVYGNNMKEIEPGIWAFYSGDINLDENIDLLDSPLLEDDISNFNFGYYTTDLNGDGNVDLLDAPILEVNINDFIFSSHP